MSVTAIGFVDVHTDEELSVVVGGAKSIVLVIAEAGPIPPLLVAFIFKVNTCPLVPLAPVFVHVQVGLEPDILAVNQVLPFVVYSQDVTALSLSVNVVERSKGLSTKLPYEVLDGVTVPGVGGVVSEQA